ncbi:hypothetical protein Nmel_011080, partial [Mimus melanotis]
GNNGNSSHPSGRLTHPRHTAAPERKKPTPVTSQHTSQLMRAQVTTELQRKLLVRSCSVCPVQLSPGEVPQAH